MRGPRYRRYAAAVYLAAAVWALWLWLVLAHPLEADPCAPGDLECRVRELCQHPQHPEPGDVYWMLAGERRDTTGLGRLVGRYCQPERP